MHMIMNVAATAERWSGDGRVQVNWSDSTEKRTEVHMARRIINTVADDDSSSGRRRVYMSN